MLRLAFRTLVERRRRALMATFAVVLGVALASSTLAVTSALEASFSGRADDALADVDVVVAPRQATEDTGATTDAAPTVPPTLLAQVRAIDGVALAAGQVFAAGWLFDDDGEPLGSSLAPDLLQSALPERLGGQRLVSGRALRGDGEAALDAVTASRAGIGLGATVQATGRGERRAYRVVGLAELGETPYAGGSALVLTERAGLALLGQRGVNRIVVGTAPGVSADVVRDRIAERLPRGVEAVTGPELADRRAEQAGERVSIVSAGLMALTGASLFVGAFLIFNTFSITVKQRLRELALLRTIAATRAQVIGIVLLEALGVGLVGSLLGVLGGLGTLPLLRAAIDRLDVALPLDDLAMTGEAIGFAVAIGLGVTLVAAIVPAWSTTRIAPLEALRSAELPPPRRQPAATARALVLLAAGAGLLSLALLGDLGLVAFLPGFVGTVLLGTALLGARLVVPLALLVAAPLELAYGIGGRIARRNVTRYPRRVSTTAAALATVVTIVAFAAVLAASYTRTAVETVDFRFPDDAIVVQGFREGATLPAEVETRVRDVAGVRTVGAMTVAHAIASDDADAIELNGVDPSTAARSYRFRWNDGSQRTLGQLADRDAVVIQDFADERELHVGDGLPLRTPTGRTVRLRVAGIFADDPNAQLGDVITTRATLRRDFGEDRLLNVVTTPARGTPPAEVERRVRQAIAGPFPTARVYTKAGLRQLFSDEAANFRRLVLALLSLAILISVLGVANTISLSIHERTREIAILRAIGATRGQIRSIVHQEGVITSLVGGTIGAGLGAALGGVFVSAASSNGFLFAFPLAVMALIVAGTLLAGYLAALLPARRAADTPILEAAADV